MELDDRNPRTETEVEETQKSERNCELKLDLEISDLDTAPLSVNKHQCQKQPREQLSGSEKAGKVLFLSFFLFRVIVLLSAFLLIWISSLSLS